MSDHAASRSPWQIRHSVVLGAIGGISEVPTEEVIQEALDNYRESTGRSLFCKENYGKICVAAVHDVLTVCFLQPGISGYLRDAKVTPLEGEFAEKAQAILLSLLSNDMAA